MATELDVNGISRVSDNKEHDDKECRVKFSNSN